MCQIYNVQGIGYFGNVLVLDTAVPPEPPPLLVGGLSTMCLPIREPGGPLYGSFTLHNIRDYASSRVQGFNSTFKLSQWIDPSKEQLKKKIKFLGSSSFC